MKPILTIAFPTYNHAKELKRCLELVFQQINGRNIEVLISDNASTDNTREIAMKFVSKYNNCKYHCNSSNLEFDGNCLQIFKHAEGDYLWMLGDDYVLPGSIDSILTALDQKPIMMHLNSCLVLNEETMTFSKPRFSEGGMLVFEDRNEIFRTVGILMTFVSTLVYNMQYVRQITDAEKYNGTLLLYCHVIIMTMAHKGKYIINTYNCVAARTNKTLRYDLYRIWINNYGDLLMKTGTESGFDKHIMNQLMHYDLTNTLYDFVLKYRISNKNSNSWNKDYVWEYVNQFPDKVIHYKIAVNSPLIVLRIIRLYRKCMQKSKALFRRIVK